MTDVASPEAPALTDEAILERFLRTKNQPTGSQTLGFRMVAVSLPTNRFFLMVHLNHGDFLEHRILL